MGQGEGDPQTEKGPHPLTLEWAPLEAERVVVEVVALETHLHEWHYGA